MDTPQLSADSFLLPSGTPNPHLVKQRLHDWLLLARDGVAENTFRAYASDWRQFQDWCQFGETIEGTSVADRSSAIDPDLIIAYIKSHLGLVSPATLRRRLSTLSKIIGIAGLVSPFTDELVKQAMQLIGRGYRKTPSRPGQMPSLYEQKLAQLHRLGLSNADLHHNEAGKQRQAAGLTWSHVLKVKAALPIEGHQWVQRKHARARALIHLAYDSMCRISEIARMNIDDLSFREQGDALVVLGQRKDNQEGEEEYAYLAADTVIELKQWLHLADVQSGPLFCAFTRNGRQIQTTDLGVQKRMLERNLHEIYKFVAKAIAVDPTLFSCHSTRVGSTQDMLEENIGMLAVKQAGRWKSDRMPSRYGKKIEATKGGMAQLAMKKGR